MICGVVTKFHPILIQPVNQRTNQRAIHLTPPLLVIPIDGKYEYGIWVSFAEIYTEKIYDLLVAPDKQHKRKSLALKYEFRSGHKYIAGLTEVKVKTIEVMNKIETEN